jgi:LemA protein
MLQSLLIAFSTLIILLLMAGVLVFYYLHSLQHELKEYWDEVLDDLRFRLDKIPNLIETVKIFTSDQDKLISETVALRAESWQLQFPDRQKVYKELAVSEKIKALFGLQKQYPDLNKDTNFLSLKTEFKELSIQTEKSSEKYNDMVRSHNKAADALILKPFMLLFRFARKPIFEYEG